MNSKLLAASLAAVGVMAGASARAAISVEYAYDDFSLYTNASTVVDMHAQLDAYDFDDDELGLNAGASSYGVGDWSTGPNDLSKVVVDEELGTASFVLDTEGDVVTNSLLSANATLINDILAGQSTEENVNGEIYLQSAITFVPSDEIEDSLQDGVDVDNGDLKFALYAYEHDVTTTEDDGEGGVTEVTATVTNLVVYHSYVSSVDPETEEKIISYTNEVISATSSIDFTQERQVVVTMKSLDGDVQNYFFKVSIDDVDVVGDLGLAEPDLVVPTTGGPWFRTVNNISSTTVSSINFSGTGNVSGIAVGYNTIDASATYDVNLAGCQNVAVTNVTDGVEIADLTQPIQLAEGVQIAFYPTVGSITNVNGQAYAGTAPYTYTVTTDASQTVTVLAGEEPTPAPTIITVTQTIGGHGGSISNGNFQAVSGVATPITITADQGYVVAQIVTNGAAVADALGETSVTFDAVFSDADGANNSIVATFAKENAWFVDPFIRNEFKSAIGTENTQAAALDIANGVVAFGTAPGASSAGIAQYDFDTLTNDFGKTTLPVYVGQQSNSHSAEYWGRSFGASPAFNAILSCNYVNANVLVSPYGGPWVGDDDATYTVAFDMGESGLASPKLYPIAINPAGTALYGTDTAGARIYKFAITADAQDAAKVGSLVYVNSWEFTGGGDLKGIGVGTFNGNDVVYMSKNASRGLWTLDVATGTLAKTGAAIDSEVYDIAVIGQADGTPRLVVSGGANVFVYDLNADGTLLADTEVFKATAASLYGTYTPATRLGTIALDDASRFVLAASAGGKIAVSVIEKKPANLIVRGTFDDGETADDRSVAFGAAASETFNAPAGQTITAVTVNGVAQTVADGATSFTYEAAALEEYVYVAMTAETPTYAVDWTGSANVAVTNVTDGIELAGTTGDFTNGVQIAFYPTVGTVTNVTVGGVEVADPATPYVYTVTTDASQVLKVLAGEAEQPAEGFAEGDTEGETTLTAAQATWLNGLYGEGKTYTDYASYKAALDNASLTAADFEKFYLLNVDPTATGAAGSIAATAIVVDTDVTVTVTLTRTGAAAQKINGVLELWGMADLSAQPAKLGTAVIDDADFSDDNTTTATFTLPASNAPTLFKAYVVAPAGN